MPASLIVGTSIIVIVAGMLHIVATWLGSAPKPDSGAAQNKTLTSTAARPRRRPATGRQDRAPAAPPQCPAASRTSSPLPAASNAPSSGVLALVETAPQAMPVAKPQARQAPPTARSPVRFNRRPNRQPPIRVPPSTGARSGNDERRSLPPAGPRPGPRPPRRTRPRPRTAPTSCRRRLAAHCVRPPPVAIPPPNTKSQCGLPKAAACRRT